MTFPPHSIKVGDPIAVTDANGNITKHIISKFTETQITVDGHRYTRSRGEEVGVHRIYAQRVRPWTKAIEDEIASAAAEDARALAESRLRDRLSALRGRVHDIDEGQLAQLDEAIAAVEHVIDSSKGFVLA